MEKITQTIENTIYGYDPKEFMPIFQDGELLNRSAFLAYKMRRAWQHLGDVASTVIERVQ